MTSDHGIEVQQCEN